jgi:ubiquinone/menaquinone biosynthesis C-methylase UbiE
LTEMNLNVGVGCDNLFAEPLMFDCLNIDVLKLHGVHVVCDLAYLPFQSRSFKDVFCFHTLEHLRNPAKGLSELVRVGFRMVEVIVPHRFGRMAKSQSWKKGNVALYHLCSFRTNWFHQCLKNFRRSVKVEYEFPRDLNIHVWIYLQETPYT